MPACCVEIKLCTYKSHSWYLKTAFKLRYIVPRPHWHLWDVFYLVFLSATSVLNCSIAFVIAPGRSQFVECPHWSIKSTLMQSGSTDRSNSAPDTSIIWNQSYCIISWTSRIHRHNICIMGSIYWNIIFTTCLSYFHHITRDDNLISYTYVTLSCLPAISWESIDLYSLHITWVSMATNRYL